MGYIAQIVPNMEEIKAKQEKRDTAKKYGWGFMTRDIAGDAGTFLKGSERVWQTQRKYVRATIKLNFKGLAEFVDHKYFTTLEEALR
jgi:hypothetical protein